MVKILNLILYNNEPEYEKMRNIIGAYLKTTGIQYYFYCYDPTIRDLYIIEGDLLKIRGVENYNPGITLKTIDAIKISLKYDYDYILRSNISTIIDIPRLTDYLDSNPMEYGGGIRFKLKWLDPMCGIHDRMHWNTIYAQGTAIVMSRKTVKLFIDNRSSADTKIIDDVCIGVFAKQFNIPTVRIGGDRSFAVNAQSATDDGIFYRNKRSDRKLDIYFMQKIIDTMTTPRKSSPTSPRKSSPTSPCKSSPTIYVSSRNHRIGRAYYGSGDRYIDVTDILFSLFVKDSQLFISRNVVFNDVFGNPVQGDKKLVYRSTLSNIRIINENRTYDVDMNIMTETKHTCLKNETP